jgi:hypothetical protein
MISATQVDNEKVPINYAKKVLQYMCLCGKFPLRRSSHYNVASTPTAMPARTLITVTASRDNDQWAESARIRPGSTSLSLRRANERTDYKLVK